MTRPARVTRATLREAPTFHASAFVALPVQPYRAMDEFPLAPPPPPRAPRTPEFWQQLLHRWFVQYNPIYLVSATLVLGGMITTSRGLAHEGSLYGPLGVAAIAEIYACALIGGAALLTRIGQRRPAVMLALITVLYQSDLTLHTETCALLGGVGIAASVAWLALFVGKLYALAWAVQIRLTRRAAATAIVGAAGVTAAPWALQHLDARGAGTAVALFVLVLGSLVPRGALDASVTLRTAGDAWRETVLRRSVRASWLIWATLLTLHVLFWSAHHRIQLGLVVPALALLALARLRSESHAWAVAIALLAGAFFLDPRALAPCALFVTVPLGHRALVTFERPARVRLLSGTASALYLAVWTAGWTGGALPEHVLALDAAFLALALLLVWRRGARLVLAPLAGTSLHAAWALGLIPQPRSMLEWGASAVALGFALLVASLVTSYRLRHVGSPEP